MARKSITTSHAAIACDVCGRTLLRGEHADVFLVGGARRMVCELCTARATHEGWIREGMDLTTAMPRANGRRSLLSRLRPRREAGHRRDDVPTGRAERGDGAASHHGALRLADASAASAAGYDVPREPRQVHAVPTNAELKVSRGLELFNGSEHPRTVAGIARSLGPPLVAARPSATEGSVVGITVAWELCWYHYEVDLADEAAGARVISQGAELSDLDPDDQVPNVAADERGELTLVKAAA